MQSVYRLADKSLRPLPVGPNILPRQGGPTREPHSWSPETKNNTDVRKLYTFKAYTVYSLLDFYYEVQVEQ